jgi:prephenate dehydratase
MGVRVAYPGGEGAHAAAACDKLFPEGAELVALPTFGAVARSVVEDEVDWGVLGIESSLAGSVAETHDLLYDLPITITAQTVIPIKHCLVGIERVPLEKIRLVRSHPAAIEACREFLTRLPNATAIAAATTSGAAHQVAADGDPTEVAIASERAARMEGLHILQEDIGDHPEAFTRFVAVATHTRLDRTDEGQEWRMAFSFVTDHRPGALFRALEPFARHSIDLAQLVSRPIPRTPWVYRFDAVLAGYPLDPLVNETLHEVIALTRELRVFGSYPVEG